jgi:type II secretory pathway pseudopilin PulG
MSNRRAVSLIETLLVIAILAVLIGMLLPAVGAARRRAMETVCKNNLGQINLAVAQLVETQKRLPAPGNSGVVGGWTIEVLPFLDQKNLRDRVTLGGADFGRAGLPPEPATHPDVPDPRRRRPTGRDRDGSCPLHPGPGGRAAVV